MLKTTPVTDTTVFFLAMVGQYAPGASSQARFAGLVARQALRACFRDSEAHFGAEDDADDAGDRLALHPSHQPTSPSSSAPTNYPIIVACVRTQPNLRSFGAF